MSKIFGMIVLGLLTVGASVGLASAAGSNNSTGQATKFGAVSAATSVPIVLTFNTPFDVIQIQASTAAPSMTVGVLDCCIPGDQWVQRTYCLQNHEKVDVRGEGNGATSGPFTGTTTVYKLGAEALECITEVRYGEGVAVFPAGMTVNFSVPGSDVINTTVESTLTTLPSE